MKQIVKKYWWQILLIFILLAASYLRLHQIRNYMTFLGDEGRDVLIVRRMIVDHKFTLLGPTASVGGFFLGPIYYYFMLPFLWFWKLDPVGPAIMVALFGIATVFLVFKMGKDLFGIRTGLLAASLYAFSPLVIAYSQSSWNPNVVPFFSLLLISKLWDVTSSKRVRDAFWVGIVLGIGIQLHYLFLFLFICVGAWYILHIRRLSILSVVGLTFLGFIVGASPFIAFEFRHGLANTRSIIQFVLAGKDTGFSASSYFSTIGDVLFRLFGRLIFRTPTSDIWSNYPVWYITSLIVLTKISLYVSLVYVAFGAVRKKSFLLLAVWFGVTVLLFGFYKKAIYDYYFGILFPLPFLLVSVVFTKLASVRRGSWIVGTLFVGLLYFNWLGRPFVYQPNNQVDQVALIARTVLDKTDGKPFNFALITGGNSDHAYRYFFEIWGRPPGVIENAQVDPIRKTVTDQLLVVCEDTLCQPVGNSLWEVAGFGRAEIAGVWDVSVVKIYKLVHYYEPTAK